MNTEQWNGYALTRFGFEGHECLIAAPEQAAPGRPWVWRAEFFGAFPSVDLALMKKGWHVAYCRLSDRYGCPDAVRDMRAFRDELVKRFDLAQKAVLFGFSRGGLYAVNYALAHPETVRSLYLDAPVMDMSSWPGGRGRQRREREWQECLACYGVTDIGTEFVGNPLNHAEELAALGLPVALVAGGADEAVPFRENGGPFCTRFEAAGGKLLLIVKPDCGHHPHSLEDPEPVVRFLTENE